jgi:hypothetical protein
MSFWRQVAGVGAGVWCGCFRAGIGRQLIKLAVSGLLSRPPECFQWRIPMSTARKVLVFPLMVLMMASSTAFAGQQHLVPPTQLAEVVADHVAKQDANRAAVHEALARPEVQQVAASLGLDLTRAAAVVDTMSAADLERAARAARDVNQQMVGGASTVVISTTTIIIILLLVIILIIVAK